MFFPAGKGPIWLSSSSFQFDQLFELLYAGRKWVREQLIGRERQLGRSIHCSGSRVAHSDEHPN